jgi:hypothetical protein
MVPVAPIFDITFAFILLLLLLSSSSSYFLLLLLEVPYVEVQIPATLKLSSFLCNITATSLDDVPDISRQLNGVIFKGINYQ